MNLASIAPRSVAAAAPAAASAPPTSVPKAPSGTTETELAAAHMTPQTRRLLPDALLDARIGRSTLAGALNDQVRFRVNRTGEVANWTIVPDSPTAAALAQSKAGPGLLRQLETAMRSTGTLEEASVLKGFVLAKDKESALAGRVLARLDDPASADGKQVERLGELGRTKVAARVMRSWGEDLNTKLARAGAWHSEGWITFAPMTSRAMLTAAGAYDPHGSHEKTLLKAKHWTTYLAGNAAHEVQHSISNPSPSAYRGTSRWMEEGTANVFSRTRTFLSANAKAAGLTPERYASKLSHEPSFDTGWKPWKVPTLPKEAQKERDKQVARDYGDSQVVLRDLVRLAGGDFRSSAGKERAFELLQRKSVRYTPGVLANAIIEHHKLDTKVYDRLRERIKGAVDIEGGVAALAREFDIT